MRQLLSPRWRRALSGRLMLALAAALLPSVPATAEGQEWNSPSALELVERGVARRHLPLQDSLLQNYSARAEGHILFLADRMDGSSPVPLRVDQVALDLHWMEPGLTRQEIRGLRAQELLPMRDFRYYLDRFTVIQNGFGDLIEVGQGMDVRSVLHPLARYVQSFYDYALGDSLTVSLPGAGEPLRVVEVRVRPRDRDLPGFEGSIFLDLASGAITRMEFGFTPASYVDRRIDRVRIALDHALWEGRYWLPYRQEVEVRREMPEIDIRVQSVIQAVLTVSDYVFNVEEPVLLTRRPGVVFPAPGSGALPEHFQRELLEELELQGLERPDLAALEAEARRVLRDRALSGLPALRLHWDRASSLVRANRAEGVRVGAGVSRRFGSSTQASLLGGWAFAAREPSGTLRLRHDLSTGVSLRLEWAQGEYRDAGGEVVGSVFGVDPVLNSVSTLVGRDFSHPYRVTGGRVGAEWWVEGGRVLRLQLSGEREEGADQPWSRGALAPRSRLRPPFPADSGDRWAARLGAEGPLLGVRLAGGVEVGWFADDPFLRATGRVGWSLRSVPQGRMAALALHGGAQVGALPQQDRFVLGGPGTLPGHPFRAYGGDRLLLLTGEVEQGLPGGWLSLRASGGGGSVGGRIRGSTGVGVGLVRGILRVDRVRGIGPGGGWGWDISVNPAFRGWL